jgi:hypothetical protein
MDNFHGLVLTDLDTDSTRARTHTHLVRTRTGTRHRLPTPTPTPLGTGSSEFGGLNVKSNQPSMQIRRQRLYVDAATARGPILPDGRSIHSEGEAGIG